MSGPTWATIAGILPLMALVVVVVLDSRSVRQRLGNREGEVTGLQLDLDAALARIRELQSYLNDYDSWATDQSLRVAPGIANRDVPDRWAAPSGQPRRRAPDA